MLSALAEETHSGSALVSCSGYLRALRAARETTEEPGNSGSRPLTNEQRRVALLVWEAATEGGGASSAAGMSPSGRPPAVVSRMAHFDALAASLSVLCGAESGEEQARVAYYLTADDAELADDGDGTAGEGDGETDSLGLRAFSAQGRALEMLRLAPTAVRWYLVAAMRVLLAVSVRLRDAVGGAGVEALALRSADAALGEKESLSVPELGLWL